MTKIFLDDFGIFLGRKRNRFVVRRNCEKHEFVADDVESIICTCPGVALSSSAIELAVKNNIQVVFARYSGWPYAILTPTTISGSVRARREQFLAYNDARGFILAKKFIEGKLKNQANLLKLLAKNRRDTNPILAENLYRAGKIIDYFYEKLLDGKASSIELARQRLMSLEAEAARAYWSAISQIIPKGFGFKGRITRGATDPFNVMLNFGYQVILFPEVWKAIYYAGLDPYAGFLHADRPGKPSLVLDLMEEFRQQTIDRILIRLISKKEVKPDEIFASEGVKGEKRLLNKNVTEKLIKSLLERLETLVIFGGKRGSLKSFIYSQARVITRFLIGDVADYKPFILGW